MTSTQEVRTLRQAIGTSRTSRIWSEIQSARPTSDFLMVDVAPGASAPNKGVEDRSCKEVFPIYSYDKTMCLEYVGYELGRPRYTIEECRKLRLTFGYPFKVRLRLVKPEPVEEEVYLGEIPDHDRGRRVHHQRLRARHREPAAPLARRRLLGRHDRLLRAQAALLLDHPRARLLDRAQRYQEGDLDGPHRPVGQVLRRDVAARPRRAAWATDQDDPARPSTSTRRSSRRARPRPRTPSPRRSPARSRWGTSSS